MVNRKESVKEIETRAKLYIENLTPAAKRAIEYRARRYGPNYCRTDFGRAVMCLTLIKLLGNENA